MNRTTFLNGDAALKERGLRHLSGVAENLTFYMNVGAYPSESFAYWLEKEYKICGDVDDIIEICRNGGRGWNLAVMREDNTLTADEILEIRDWVRQADDMCDMHENGHVIYGLSIDYRRADDDNDEGYLRYQFSWGGPSDELRFYVSPGSGRPYRIEYVFLDWFVGVGFDVTNEDWAMWCWNYLHHSGIYDSELQRAMEV